MTSLGIRIQHTGEGRFPEAKSIHSTDDKQNHQKEEINFFYSLQQTMNRIQSILRLIRPIIHGMIIVLVFYAMYRLRFFTDLIPGVQLRIPVINYSETMAYACMSALAFITVGIVKKLYELNKPIQNYFQTFTKVRIYRVITITFIAYFGQDFIFFFGISRFIIIIGSLVSFFILFFFDQARNYLEAKKHREGESKILIIGSDTLESYKAIEKIKNGFSFKTEFVGLVDLGKMDIDMKNYLMVVAVGSFEKKALQNIFEKIRFSDTRFYHISE
jgi:hypothetical protein